VKQPFYGGYGLIAEDGIPKPAFNAFLLLHRLGDQRLAVSSDDILATRRADGTLVIAAWNLTDPGTTASSKAIDLQFQHAKVSRIKIDRLDSDHGDVHKAYEAMGSPRYPTMQQIKTLQEAAKLAPGETREVKNASLAIQIPARGLVLLEIPATY
jgi:xylan 1,4-beta-xylosidase